jgi:WD40-like Beta Propeller Repeat
MRERLSTLAVAAVVGCVAAAAAIDSLTGGSGSSPPVARPAPARPVAGEPAAPEVVGGTILQAGRVAGAHVPPGLLVALPAEPSPQSVGVGIRPARPGSVRIRLRGERLRLGPAVGTPSDERIAMWAWSPSRPSEDGIYSQAAAGGALGRITRAPRGRLEQPLAYSPDGSSLLFFESFRGGRDGVVDVVRANSTGRVTLTPPGMTSWCCDLGAPAAWSPDGRRIAFAGFAPGAAGRDGASAIYVAGADGSHVHRITPTLSWATAARWSPDGRWIAFDQADRPGGAHDIFLVHPDGTGLHAIPTATDAAASCCPQWSPDSRSLIYASGTSSAAVHLWRVNIDGSGRREVFGGVPPA